MIEDYTVGLDLPKLKDGETYYDTYNLREGILWAEWLQSLGFVRDECYDINLDDFIGWCHGKLAEMDYCACLENR